MLCDNKSTISIAENPTLHGRTKHIDIKFHFIRNLVFDGMISLMHCSTENQLADLFTKPVPIQKHIYLRSMLGVCAFQSREGARVDCKVNMLVILSRACFLRECKTWSYALVICKLLHV